MSKAQKQHYNRVAELGCCLCRHALGMPGTPAEIHHIRKAGRRNDAPVIPLCPEHHRGNTGIHGLGAKGFLRMWGKSEDDLLALTLNDLHKC